MEHFRFWVQNVLPIVYDDSLSYYEVLAKCTKYINAIIDELKTVEDTIDNLDIEHLNEVVNEMEELIENIPVDQLETLVSDVATLKDDVEELQGIIQTLSGNIDSIQDDIDDINDNIEKIENYRIGKVPKVNVSIIGDSISTYDQPGYKVDGYTMWYPRGDVDSVDKTWWYKVIENSGAELMINASYSGSRVTNTHATAPDFYQRTGSDIIGSPDAIIVALGTNDSSHEIPLGEYDFTSDISSLSEATFRTAYIKGIKSLKSNFPNAYIYCVCMSMSDAYRDSIIRICDELDVICLQCDRYTVVSTVHPNTVGMDAIACEFTNSTDFSRCTEIINNAKSIRTVLATPDMPEGTSVNSIILNQYGKLVIIEINVLSFNEISSSYVNIVNGLPLPGANTYIGELNPSSMSVASGEKTTCRVRVTNTGILQYARGINNTNYSGIIIYIAK